jgi:membrane protein implicated in regulation of membrane protease activity
MSAWLAQASFWHWWIAAFAFLILELMAPGILFLWLAIGAGVTGFLLLAASGLSFEIQGLVFALVSLASALLGRSWLKKRGIASDHPSLNRRSESFIGQTHQLSEPIVNGTGRMRLGDTEWKVTGPDLPAGANVKITSADGITLRVEPL